MNILINSILKTNPTVQLQPVAAGKQSSSTRCASFFFFSNFIYTEMLLLEKILALAHAASIYSYKIERHKIHTHIGI